MTMCDIDWPDPNPPTLEQQAESEDAAAAMTRAATALRRAVLAINDAAAECGLTDTDLDDAYMHIANHRPRLHRATAALVGPKAMLAIADLIESHAKSAVEIGPDHRALNAARTILGGQ